FDVHGDTLQYYLFDTNVLSTRDPAVAREMMHDSEYFYKKVLFPFSEIKALANDGLFTTSSTDEVWKLSHRLLMPAFSASAMKIYAEDMVRIAEKASALVATYSSDQPIDVVNFTTNVTFQTVGQVGLGHDFRLLDSSDSPQHPFIFGMNYCLGEIVKRASRTRYWKHLPIDSNYQFAEHLAAMKSIMQEVIDERRRSPDATNMKKDLLGFMLNARAPNSDGELTGLSDDVIHDQIITFGIAGSETTANTLSWILYLLDKHPAVQARVLQEMANVGIVPDKQVTVKQSSQLTYLTQVMKETLRLFPPVGTLSKYCTKDCVLPGGFIVRKGMSTRINVWAMHHSEKVYPNPFTFDPDRFSAENIKKIPDGAWLPFSSGPRACIGMQFALIEMRIVLATLLPRFQFTVADGGEVTYVRRAITAKPDGLAMTAHKREDFPDPSSDVAVAEAASAGATVDLRTVGKPALDSAALPSATVAYGSNMGTSEDYAIQMGKQLRMMGYTDVAIKPLDEWDFAATAADSKRSLVVVITSTYNGVPPDNAAAFAKAIEAETRTDLLKDVDYVVFGCGNTMWRTFQKFPRFVFDRLGQLGATPIAEFQYGDSNKDLDEDYLQWSLRMGAHLAEHYGSGAGGLAEVVAAKALPFSLKLVPRAETGSVVPFRVAPENATIKVSRELQDVEKSGGRSTRHIEITLSESAGISYQTGDHLNVYPVNSANTVREVAAILDLASDSAFALEQIADAARYSRSAAAAINGHSCTVADAIQYVCDWKEAPSRDLVVALSDLASTSDSNGDTKLAALKAAAHDVNTAGKQSAGWTAFLSQYRTVLDVLRSFAPLARQIPLESLLHYVNAMAPRRYSIASCQAVVGNEVHISVAIVNDVVNGRSYGGLATEYLASLEAGAPVSVSHKPAQAVFHLPESRDVPVVFVGAGTGIAPFRGFLQEMQGTRSSSAELYFGCRSPEYDYLYKDELNAYVEDGTLTKLHTAFSRIGDARKYVQHHIAADGASIWKHLNEKNGRIYVCGSADRLARDVVAAMLCIFEQSGGLSPDSAKNYLSDLVSAGRYVEDVW
ncbi:cytochrome P450, partial [Martensiomyces pterosporus]